MTPPTQHDLILAEAVRALAVDKCLGEKVAGLDAERIAHNTACNDCADAIWLMDLSALLAAHIHPTMKVAGRDLYRARYEHEGAQWEANEHQHVWNDWADRLNARLAAIHPTPQDAQDVQRSATVGPCESSYVDIVFDGPPSHESGRFVEVEDAAGRSINFGKWVQRADGYWALRIGDDGIADKPNREAFLRGYGSPKPKEQVIEPHSHGTAVESAPAATASEGLSEGLAGEPVAWMKEHGAEHGPTFTTDKEAVATWAKIGQPLVPLYLATPQAAPSLPSEDPMDEWVDYAKRSGLLDENGVAIDRCQTQTAWFAFTSAWNRCALQSKPASTAAQVKPIPMAALTSILNEAMERAVKNGANSVSMPDEYVAAAHFLAHPHEYCPAAQEAPQLTDEQPVQPCKDLITAANNLCAYIGHHGEINARHDHVQMLMDALAEYDGSTAAQEAPQLTDEQKAIQQLKDKMAAEPWKEWKGYEIVALLSAAQTKEQN